MNKEKINKKYHSLLDNYYIYFCCNIWYFKIGISNSKFDFLFITIIMLLNVFSPV